MLHLRLALLDALRGQAESARHHLARCEAWKASDDVQDPCRLRGRRKRGRPCRGELPRSPSRLRSGRSTPRLRGGLALAHEAVRLGFPYALDAAIAVGDLDGADRLVGLIASRPPGEIPPFLRAEIRHARALLGAARGEDEGVEEGLSAAEEEFRELGYPYWTARVQLDLAAWFESQGRATDAAIRAGMAAATFAQLETQPMLVRARALSALDASVV